MKIRDINKINAALSTRPFKILGATHQIFHFEKDDGEKLIIYGGGDRFIELKLTAECCSQSFFEKIALSEVINMTGSLFKIEHVAAAKTNSDEISYHAVKLTTGESEIILDWRNESNGYYDGECEVTYYDGN